MNREVPILKVRYSLEGIGVVILHLPTYNSAKKRLFGLIGLIIVLYSRYASPVRNQYCKKVDLWLEMGEVDDGRYGYLFDCEY